jgi:hypothetical protein
VQAAFFVFLWSLGCGSIGEPLPPLLNIPERSVDLTVRQTERGIILEWTWPETTTEGMPLTDLERFAVHFMKDPGPHYDFETQSDRILDVEGADIGNLGPGDRVRVIVDPRPFMGQIVAIGVRAESRRRKSGGFSNLIVLVVRPPPPAPAAPQLSVEVDAIEVTWRAVEAARSYRLYRRTESGEGFEPIATTAETRYRDGGFNWDETYAYRVQSIAGEGEVEGGTSDPSRITARDTFPPAAPMGLLVVPGLDSIELSWRPGPEPDLAGYRLHRVAGDAEATVLEPSLITALNFNDKEVQQGITYRYQLTAVDRDNNESPATASPEVRLP